MLLRVAKKQVISVRRKCPLKIHTQQLLIATQDSQLDDRIRLAGHDIPAHAG